MPVGEQPDDQPLNQVFLAHDDFINLVEQRTQTRARLLHRLIDDAYTGIHSLSSL